MARPRKLTDENLMDILENYTSKIPYITTIQYTDLARFINRNGYENVTHQDFCRNKLIKILLMSTKSKTN